MIDVSSAGVRSKRCPAEHLKAFPIKISLLYNTDVRVNFETRSIVRHEGSRLQLSSRAEGRRLKVDG